MFRIREYDPVDLPVLYALDQSCFVSEIAYSLDELEYFIEHRDSITLVAEANSAAVIGFCIVEKVRSRGKFSGHLITIDVAAESRQQGVGSALMRAMEGHLRQANIFRIRLEVAINNLTAQRFYRSFGYQPCGRMEGYYPGNLDALVMEKFLEPKSNQVEL